MTNDNRHGGAGPMLLLAALVFLNILNFADRYLLIAFSNAIVTELSLTHLQFGLLTGIVFTGVYTVFGLFTGSLADRMHRPRLIASGLALWSALTALTGATRSFGQMAAARLFIGVGEACLTPASLSLLAERFAPARRAFASGVYYMGFPVGIGLSFIFAGIVGPSIGWRGGFIVLGIVGIVAALLVAMLMRDVARGDAGRASAPAHSFGDTFKGIGAELRSNRPLVLTLVGSGLVIFTVGGSILDLLWWIHERDYAPAEAQKTLGNLLMYGGGVGALLGGSLGDWAQKRWSGGRLKFLVVAYLVAAPIVTLYRFLPGHTPLFLAGAFCASISALLLFGPALSAIQDVMPAQHRAAGISLFVLVTSLFGAGGGNAMAGWLADHFKEIGSATPLTNALILMQIPGALAIPIFWLAARAMKSRD